MSPASKGNLLGGRCAPLAITGVGIVSPAGSGVGALRAALAERRACFSPLAELSNGARGGIEAVGGLVPRVPSGHARAASLASAAAIQALLQARIGEGRIALCLGTALADSAELEREVERERSSGLSTAGGPRDSCFDILSDDVERELLKAVPGANWLAPSLFSVTCVSGNCALEQAAADLAFGRADCALVGGVDLLTRFMHSGFQALGALSVSGELKPFGADHDGILVGEGAAFLTLESLERARARGATVLGCLMSQALVSDARHLTSPDPEGHGMARAITRTLGDCGLDPSELGGATLTAIGSKVYDRMLSRSMIEALGEEIGSKVPVSSWESATGHLLAATGVVGYVYASMALSQGFLDPVWGVGERDLDCRLRSAIDQPEALLGPNVLALTVGFGGQNGAALITSEALAVDLSRRRVRSRSSSREGDP